VAPVFGESIQDAVISKTPDGVRETSPLAIPASAVGNNVTDIRRPSKNIRTPRPR